jgi:hypothetical protein
MKINNKVAVIQGAYLASVNMILDKLSAGRVKSLDDHFLSLK